MLISGHTDSQVDRSTGEQVQLTHNDLSTRVDRLTGGHVRNTHNALHPYILTS